LKDNKGQRGRVGLFICNYTFGGSAQAINWAIMLAQRGYEVDIFLHNAARKELVTFETGSIRLYDLNSYISNSTSEGKAQVSYVIKVKIE